MTTPSIPPPAPAPVVTRPKGTEADALRLVRIVCGEIVRGRRAARGRAVLFYKVHTFLSILLSGLGGVAVAQTQYPALRPGGIAAFVIAAVLAAYKTMRVEEIAINALAAQDAFNKLEFDLIQAVQQDGENPIEQLKLVRNNSGSMTANFYKVLPERRVDFAEEEKELMTAILKDKGNWVF